jgi:hypothetical protein
MAAGVSSGDRPPNGRRIRPIEKPFAPAHPVDAVEAPLAGQSVVVGAPA